MEPTPGDIAPGDGEHEFVLVVHGEPPPRPAQEVPSETPPSDTPPSEAFPSEAPPDNAPPEEAPPEELPLRHIFRALRPPPPSPPLPSNSPGQRQPPNVLDRPKRDRSWKPSDHKISENTKARGLSREEIQQRGAAPHPDDSYDSDDGDDGDDGYDDDEGDDDDVGNDNDGNVGDNGHDYFYLNIYNDNTSALVSDRQDANLPGVAELNVLRIAHTTNVGARDVDCAMEYATKSIHRLVMEMYHMEMRKRAKREMGWMEVGAVDNVRYMGPNMDESNDVDMDDAVEDETLEVKRQRLVYAELSHEAMIRAASQICSSPYTCTCNAGQPRSVDEDIARIEAIMPIHAFVLEVLLSNVYAHMRMAGRVAARAFTFHQLAGGEGEALAVEGENFQAVLEMDHRVRKRQAAIDRGEAQAQAAAEEVRVEIEVETDNGFELLQPYFESSFERGGYCPTLPDNPKLNPGFWQYGDFDNPDYFMNKGYPCGKWYTSQHVKDDAIRAKKAARLVDIPQVKALLVEYGSSSGEKRYRYLKTLGNTNTMRYPNYMSPQNLYNRFADAADEMYLVALNIEKLLQAAVLLLKDCKMRGKNENLGAGWAHWGNNNPYIPQIVDEINAVAHKVRLSDAFCEAEKAIMEIEGVCKDLRDPFTLSKRTSEAPVGGLIRLQPVQNH